MAPSKTQASSRRYARTRSHGSCYAGAVTTPEQRAERRRQTWQGGSAASFAEMDERDLEFWLSMSPAERLKAMWGLVEDSLAFTEQRGPTPRLQRLAGGARPLRG